MKIILEVTKCAQCPFIDLEEYNQYEFCNHPSKAGMDPRNFMFRIADIQSIPYFCPELIANETHKAMRVPKDSVLADYLEERGFQKEALELREDLS